MGNWLNVISHSSAVAKGAKPVLGSFLTPTRYSLLIYTGITLLLCLALVQLLREHAIQLWYPQLKKDVEKLEIFQRRATRMTEGLENMPYSGAHLLSLPNSKSRKAQVWFSSMLYKEEKCRNRSSFGQQYNKNW